jgi:hypothetical protein
MTGTKAILGLKKYLTHRYKNDGGHGSQMPISDPPPCNVTVLFRLARQPSDSRPPMVGVCLYLPDVTASKQQGELRDISAARLV